MWVSVRGQSSPPLNSHNKKDLVSSPVWWETETNKETLFEIALLSRKSIEMVPFISQKIVEPSLLVAAHGPFYLPECQCVSTQRTVFFTQSWSGNTCLGHLKAFLTTTRFSINIIHFFRKFHMVFIPQPRKILMTNICWISDWFVTILNWIKHNFFAGLK